jgi:hypothetical protein
MQASKSWKICVRNGRLWRQLFAREFGEMSVKVIEKDPKFNHVRSSHEIERYFAQHS